MLTETEVWESLPSHGFLRAFVEYASERTDAHIAYHVAGGLSLLAQCVPIQYEMPYASPIRGNLFAMVVGGSSKSRKTSSISIAARVLRDALPSALQETPGSSEGLIESVRREPKQLILYPEFGEFLSKAEEGYFQAMKTALTSAWDCMPMGRATVKSSLGEIQNPRLSVLAAVATDLLERHTEESDWTGGFIARFLTFYGEPERTFITPPIDDAMKRMRLAEWLRGLADLSLTLSDGSVAHAPGVCTGLSPAAERLWHEWAVGEMEKCRDAGTRVQASIARATSHAAKIAILLAWDIGRARSGLQWQIGIEEVRSALAITSLHLKSVIELGDRVTGSRDMRDRRAVLNAIGKDRATPLGAVIRRAGLLKRRADEILSTLVEEHAVRQVSSAGKVSFIQSPEEARALLREDAAAPQGELPDFGTPAALQRVAAPVPRSSSLPAPLPPAALRYSVDDDDDDRDMECDEPPAGIRVH